MVTKKRRIASTDEPLPEDYYDSFAGRGQDEQDQWDLEKGLLPSETVQGVGLGLPITKAIMHAHRGEVKVRCADGRSTFTLEFAGT